jgi:uncharacterized protein (TIGR02391 family)
MYSATSSMVQKKSLEETIELVRDILKLFGDFAHDAALLEKEHNFSINDLGELLKDVDVNALFTHPDTKLRQAVFPLFAISQIPELSDFVGISASRKVEFAQKVYGISSQLEDSVGKSKVLSRPSDLDRDVISRCANKDYHDTVHNAFPLIEDRLRSKTSVGKDYFGQRLIDHAFNDKTGKLVLGDTASEKEGVYLFFKGAYEFFRNPPAHSISTDESRNAALKVVHMTDLMIKLIDKASLRT